MREIQTPIAKLGPTYLFERAAVVLIVLFPVMGVFFAPETYISPPSFSLGHTAAAADAGVGIGRIGYLAIALWLISQYLRFPLAMFRALWRSALPVSFGVWMIVTGFWSFDPDASIKTGVRALLVILFAVYLIERFDWRELIGLLSLSAALGIIASMLAIVLIPTLASSEAFGNESGGWRGAFLTKNTLGAAMSYSFVVGYYAKRISAGTKAPVVGLFVALGSIILIALSRSATAVVIVPFAILLMSFVELMTRARKRPMERLLILLAAALLSCLFIFLLLDIDEVFELLGRDATLTGRTNVWRIVTLMIEKNPIWGYGVDFWSIDSPYRSYIWNYLQWSAPHAHNSAMDTWFQLGIIGLAISMCIMTLCLWRTLRFLYQGVAAEIAIWAVIAMLMMLRGVTETTIIPPGSDIFWMTLAFAGLARAARQKAKVPRPGITFEFSRRSERRLANPK